ncbi:unnamed protein product, partial [Cladocopium goreaui]
MPSTTTPSVIAAVSLGAIVDVKDKNSLYVSNLSVNVTENSLREVFHSCGQLDEVIFRTYPGSLKWYAQLNFRSPEGVVQGSKMEGTPICGTGIRCSAIDPTSFAANEVLARLQAKEDAANKEDPEVARQEWHKKLREHAEARKLRTVHIDGLPQNTTLQGLQRLGEQFGAVEQLRLDRDDKGAPFGLIQFKELGIARGCCLRRTFLVDDHVVLISESKSEVNSTDIEEATVEFQHPCIDRALAAASGGEQTKAPQGKFWEDLAEKRRQLYNSKLEQVRQNAEAILGPGVAPSPPPSPEEDDFFAWAKQAVAWAVPMDPAAEEAQEEAPDGIQEEEERGPVDLEEHPDIVPGTELAVLNDSSEEEISDGASEEGGVDVVGGAFADGPKARRQRRAALRAQRNKTRPKVAVTQVTPSQWAAQRAQAMERLQSSPAQWAAARQRALERLKAKRPAAGHVVSLEEVQLEETEMVLETVPETVPETVLDLDVEPKPKRARLCILRTVQRTGAKYALWSHQKLAAAAGVPADVIETLSQGRDCKECQSLDARESAALALSDALLEAGMNVSEATYAVALGALGERQTFEVACTVGFYLLLS